MLEYIEAFIQKKGVGGFTALLGTSAYLFSQLRGFKIAGIRLQGLSLCHTKKNRSSSMPKKRSGWLVY